MDRDLTVAITLRGATVSATDLRAFLSDLPADATIRIKQDDGGTQLDGLSTTISATWRQGTNTKGNDHE